ncbi:hypothetical protein GXB85_01830 [Cellulomonas sp. APG4]|uniref:S8 family serine peptidase n=1 Tax=Cellulomonas sp. APG4 TaxID=1538656 RepID=UPI00137B477F|nr:S8 family serine peptidase [Cellulomonas sp. APG4]NCT89700.1 hypothetical protein [Cellulomonas sp. APG4]
MSTEAAVPAHVDGGGGVTDCARWARTHVPHGVGLPVARFGEGHPDAGWRVRVALLHGPVDTEHPDLAGARTTTWPGVRGLHPGTPDPLSTAYAALLVGQGRAQVRGLVPAAHLLVAPVLAAGRQHADELVARAVRWAVAEGAHVVALPIARRRLGRRLSVTLRRATAAGVTVLAPAGDRGPHDVAFPASVTGVVAVAAHDGEHLLPGASELADVAAPGQDVPGAGPAGTTPLSGSAPATVLAAGAAAAARSALALELFGSLHGDPPLPQGWTTHGAG